MAHTTELLSVLLNKIHQVMCAACSVFILFLQEFPNLKCTLKSLCLAGRIYELVEGSTGYGFLEARILHQLICFQCSCVVTSLQNTYYPFEKSPQYL